ncbi:uncharacterized protein LOC130636592 isoform X2 [Hydractinia symbiolongicarpus]|uniref:uncharacterized protein LOC130636592 isoform X2 n=1 Tax=Hydractinia symbiolongicarpus TaxID=13093 RepID=UPI00254BF067|nr:uncharacterized protein LOC130636592 isoform X2 [Hydractinia symbiolongicarpus]
MELVLEKIAGIILDNFCRGRKKHIWFSISSDLRHDAARDLQDIGCFINVIDGCQQLDKGMKAFGLVSDFQEGVLFSTYSTLVSSSLKDQKKSSRLDQLIKWCNKDFDGCLIFDECHKAKHFLPGKEKSSTKVALAVTMIQRLLPKARVLYCSATGVTDVKNMAFMERLGIWGVGTTFKDFTSFLDSLTSRGLGALEMLSMEMKAAGMYVSRGLSYQEAEFQTVEAKLTEEQIKIYDKAVHVWKELKKALAVALNRTASAKTRVWSHFWACHQRFFKQLCMSMKLPEIVKQARQALSEGYCVVIGLQTTGEASLATELDQNDGHIDNFVSLTREMLRRFIIQYFPTEIAGTGKLPKIDNWCVEAKTLLINFSERITLPNSPLDELIDELGGPNCVAEMTGRRGFVGRYSKKDKPSYYLRGGASNNVDSISVQERNAFMNGEKLVAIISDAASTGISLHADVRSKNQKRRVHITAELPWSADKAVQQLGRSHRSNQSSGPIYKLVTSNLGGERRFAAAVAKRLQSLGALTKGDRRAATGADLTQFNFDTPYGRQALKLMYEAIAQRKLFVGLSLADVCQSVGNDVKESVDGFQDKMKSCLVDMDVLEQNVVGANVLDFNAKNVGKFLNRILGLEVNKQNLIFGYFCKCLDAMTEAAKKEGRYNDGVTDIRGNSITLTGQPRVVFKEAQLGSSVTRHVLVLVDRGVPFEQAVEKYNVNKHNESGFYRSKRDQYGRKLYVLAIQKERSNHLFTVMRPNTGMSAFEEEKADLFHKYDRIEPFDAEIGWTEQYERTRTGCIHGNKCKHITTCKIGSRITELHLLTGRILSILPSLEAVVAKFAHALQLPREHRNLRVVRVELDSGERVVGLRYPDILISEAERYIKEQKLMLRQQTGQITEIITEEETPVNKKSQVKAFNKSKTIKSFFTAPVEENGCTKEGRSKSSNDLNSIENASVTETCNNSSKKVTESNSDSSIAHNPGKNKKMKRSLSNNVTSSPRGKRQKQTNLFNMMFTQNQKKKSRACPVCQKSLEGIGNEDINKHIDSCLID